MHSLPVFFFTKNIDIIHIIIKVIKVVPKCTCLSCLTNAVTAQPEDNDNIKYKDLPLRLNICENYSIQSWKNRKKVAPVIIL